MRDLKRIQNNWKKLAELHEKFPDWRMGQLLMNIFSDIKKDPFYLEDDEFLKEVDDLVNLWTRE